MAVRKPAAVAEPEESTALAHTLPSPPAEQEWRLMRQQATLLAKSDFVPKEYRGKPDDVLIAAMYGRDLGLTMTVALKHINVINGRPGLSAEVMRALIKRGGHKLEIPELTDKRCRIVATRRDTGEVYDILYTIDMARRAGLLTNAVYGKHTESMLLARCTTLTARAGFSDVLAGMTYSPEELLEVAATKGETEIARLPEPVAAEDRDDAVGEALKGEVVDHDAGDQKPDEPAAPKVELDGRPLSQRERDSLKERCGTMEDARRLTAEAYRALGIQSGGVWIGWEGEAADAKFAYLTAAHRDWIEARLA